MSELQKIQVTTVTNSKIRQTKLQRWLTAQFSNVKNMHLIQILVLHSEKT